MVVLTSATWPSSATLICTGRVTSQTRFQRIAELADVVIIDEAHHFRNPGTRGSDNGRGPSRYYRLYDLLDNVVRPKTLFMLTATQSTTG